MEFVNQYLTNLPIQIDLMTMVTFIGYFAVAALVIGLLARVIFGKRSSMNHALSSAMGILCIYIVSIVVHTFDPFDLSRFLTPLPFVRFSGESMAILTFSDMDLTSVCYEVLSTVILAFLVNLLDTWIPKGKKIIGWYGFRFLTVLFSMVLHYFVTWAFSTYLPGALATYAPLVLIGILLAMIALGLLNLILGLVITVVNPILGAIYTFFFSNIIGKQITKAVVTTVVLCAVVFALNYFGYAWISISASALSAYIPLFASLLILWYLIGHVL